MSIELENTKKFEDTDNVNDHINIYGDIDVKVSKLKSTEENELRLEIKGNNIDYSIINALRRTILMKIPIYAFHRSNIFIETAKSRHMYNNDLLYNQFETLPIFDLSNEYDLENPELYLSNKVMKNIFGKFLPEKFIEEVDENDNDDNNDDSNKKLLKVEMSMNVKNNTSSDIFASSHDAILRVNGKIVDSYMKRKRICIIALKPSEEISLRAEANLGIAKIHAIYEATTNAIHDEITPTKFHLWYETLEQLEKEVIFSKACIILSKQLNNLKSYLTKNFSAERDPTEIVEIQLYGEDHTMGNILATILQKCEFVEKAGYCMPHALIDEIKLQYCLFPKTKKDPIKILIDCIKYLIKVFDKIGEQFNKIK